MPGSANVGQCSIPAPFPVQSGNTHFNSDVTVTADHLVYVCQGLDGSELFLFIWSVHDFFRALLVKHNVVLVSLEMNNAYPDAREI